MKFEKGLSENKDFFGILFDIFLRDEVIKDYGKYDEFDKIKD